MRKRSDDDTERNPNTVYEMVTERVVELLEQGTAPWRKPWNVKQHAPRNIDGYRYRGINVFLLLTSGYASPYWLTFKQAKARGGNVRKGERSTVIVFWKRLTVKDDEQSAAKGKDVFKVIPLLRYYRVFNLEQCEGVRLPKDAITVEPVAADPVEAIAAAEAVMAGYPDPPTVTESGSSAYYRPAADHVQVPPRETFSSADAFYATMFHELGHSTGHARRLARKGIMEIGQFGAYQYGREELIAEMTAAFLCGEAGILPATIENSAAYLRSWIETIKTDVRAVVVAAGAAQRAADHILGRAEEREQQTEQAA